MKSKEDLSKIEKKIVVMELKDVYKIYKIEDVLVNALNGVNLQIKEGDYFAIRGASGSGKSTFMHLLGCLDFPTKGKILFDNLDISKMSENELAKIRGKRIGFVFQSFNLINTLTALENVMLPMNFQNNISQEEKIERAKKMLGLVEMAHRVNHLPKQLSGGEQQRVAIARALVNDPKIILADEPTGNLDSKTSHAIMEIFDKINKEGKTIVLVTHEEDIAEHAKKTIVVKDGKIIEIKKNY
jgi:putative ABC transport system ATP-binding protein